MLSLPDLPASALEAAALVGRRVALQGRWMADATVYLDNRPMNGRPGMIVATPLLLADGSAIVVQRGWLARDAGERTRIAPYVTPDGLVGIEGRIALEPSRLYELGTAASGPIRQNLHVESFGREINRPLRPLTVLQDATPSARADGLLRDWPQPATDLHKHYGYAFQWFALSALISLSYVWLQVLRPRRPADA
jgi:surfeit locus 1 family protein